MSSDELNWYTVGGYRLDGTVAMETVIEELEQTSWVASVDEADGYVMAAPDMPFHSSATDLAEVKAAARLALPQPRGCDMPDVVNVTRGSDMVVFDFDLESCDGQRA